MDYEKKYKEALETARKINSGEGIAVPSDWSVYEAIFPELRESEDERIRKEIINFLELPHPQFVGKRDHEKWIAWLEKQGESYTKKDVDNAYLEGMAFAKHELEKQGEKKPTIEMKSAEESLGIDSDAYNEIVDECIYGEKKPADFGEQKCEESKTKVFDAPTPFEDKLYAFVAACEFLAIPSKIEFILKHSQEILDAAREQIGKEQSSTWSKEDEEMRLTVLQDLQNIKDSYPNINVEPELNWLKSLKDKYTWKPSEEQIKACKEVYADILSAKGFEIGTINNELNRMEEQLKKLTE